MQVLNFYSAVFADQLKKGRKTATIRLGDKSHKYRKNQVVLVTIGYQHSPREKIFEAVVDQVEVKRIKELSPRDIEHDNPEFRRTEEMIHFLEQIYGRKVELEDTVTVVRFSQIVDSPTELSDRLLSERMKELEAHGVVERTVVPGPPVRVEYGLTEMGRELEPALSELKSWARRWLDAPDKARAGRRGRTPAETR